MLKFDGPALRFFSGLRLGEFGRGKWMAVMRIEGLAPRDSLSAGCSSPRPLTKLRGGLIIGRDYPRTQSAPAKIVTWLILPVVICLSQRLSHACLSISNYTVKLRMAH